MILKYSQWEWKLKTCQERPVLVCGRFTKMFYKTVIFQNFFPPVFHVGLCSYEWKCIILTWSALHVIRYEKIYHKCLNLANVNGFYLWCIYSTCQGKCTLCYRKLRNKPVCRDFWDSHAFLCVTFLIIDYFPFDFLCK